jgi:hypothetical protein
MSSSETEESVVLEPAPMNSSKPAMALALCLTLLGLASIFWAPKHAIDVSTLEEKTQLQPPHWQPSTQEAEQLNRLANLRRQVELDTQDPLAKRLMQRMHEFHRIELLPGANRRSAAYQEAHAHYTQRARDYLAHRGKDGFLSLGQQVVDAYIQALNSDRKAAIENLGGRLYRHAKSSRLLHPDGLLEPANEMILRLAVMERWLRPLLSTQVVAGWLSSVERRILRRWKLVAQNLTPKRRMELAKELLTLDSTYPVWWAMAAHAAEARDWVGAAAFYDKALLVDPENSVLKLNRDYALQRTRLNQSAPQ